jgi:hypothetical protein
LGRPAVPFLSTGRPTVSAARSRKAYFLGGVAEASAVQAELPFALQALTR